MAPRRGVPHLAAVNRAARDLGLAPGLALAEARARLPGLRVRDHEPAADAALLAAIAEDCRRWTPLVGLDPPQGLLLDLAGCAHLFGGEAALRRRILQRLRRAGLTVQGSLAATPDAARALARFGRIAVVPPGGEAAAVGTLPLAALEAEAETVTALHRAGFRRLADLAALPRAALAARFGPPLATRLARLLGEEDRPIAPLIPLPDCAAERRFAEPIRRRSDVEAALQGLLGEVAAQLAARGQGGRRFEALLVRSDGLARRLEVATGRPSREPASLARLFHEALEALAEPLDAGCGFERIRLRVAAAEPLAPAQQGLDGSAAAAAALDELLDRLAARFGPGRVLRFAAADSHDPLRAARLAPAAGATPAADPAWLRPEPGEPPPRPLRLLAPPQPIEALAEVPDGPPLRFRWRRSLHEVVRAEGPERIAPEWWREGRMRLRDYYRVEDAAGRRFWLFRAGLHGEAPPPRWYLHGLFA